MVKDVNGLEIWEIKSTNDRCKHLIGGKCHRNYKIDDILDGFAPPWCRKEICEIRI